ncbi:MAG TPA: hypothetical protein EYM30_05255 [Verrucomicrobia bacterium]|nr:hypothetical protein [Verrucomicrobiota bacterium]|tara:strand:- start:1538 stop:2152 length:615 start_codon:yes stop_codon:yes gene_type:complete
MSETGQMKLLEALEIIRCHRGDGVVITTMSSACEWQQFEPHPKDFVYIPSSMGQGPPLGLGIALAQPTQRVIVVNGDGCLLMNLGALVTITGQAPENFTLINVENGIYEVTGGQATAAAAPKRKGETPVVFTELARASGFVEIHEFDDIESWRDGVGVMHHEGPVFINLKVAPGTGNLRARSPGPALERAQKLRETLCGTPDPS